MFEPSLGLILIEFSEEAKQNVCGIETGRPSVCLWLNKPCNAVLPWRPEISAAGHWYRGLGPAQCHDSRLSALCPLLPHLGLQ